MANKDKVSSNPRLSGQKPANTAEGQMDRLVALAASRAEQQLIDGTASSQVITFFLKYGTAQAKLECEKLKHENELLEAKTADIRANAHDSEFYERVMNAITRYKDGEEP